MKRLVRKILTEWSTPITLVFVVLALAGAYVSKDIELKLSLTDLLPQDHPAVIKFNQLTEIVGGVGYIEVLLHADDGKSHLANAPKIVEALKQSPMVRSAFFEREEHFFLTRALYYIDLARLKTLESSIEKEITHAKRQIFDIGLWDDETPEKVAAIDPELKKFAERAAKVTPQLISPDAKTLLIMVKPSFDSLDFSSSRKLVDYVKNTLQRDLPANVTFRLSGRYYGKIIDADMIEEDIFILGILSNLVMAILLLLYFRSIRAVISIFIPVALGLGCTALATRFVIGHINIVTGFLVGIISGVGSDYGIHMLWRLRLEQRNPSSADPDPLWRTLATSGWANFVTIISTGLCFFMMCGSSFRVFSEFGFICGVGLSTILFSKLGSFYCTSKLLNLEKVVKEGKYPFQTWVLPILSSQRSFVIGLMLTGVLALMATRVGFEFDFEKMMQHSQEIRDADQLVDKIYDRSTTPSAFAATSREQALAVEKLLKDKYVPGIVESIVSGATIVPDDQKEKQVILAHIKTLIAPFRDKYIESAMGVPAKSIRAWVNATPFTFDELPLYLKEALRGTKQASYLIYVYPHGHMNTAQHVSAFAGMVRDVGDHFPGLVSGSDAAIFADILELIEHDGLILLTLILIFVGVFIWISLRSFKEALLCYIPFVLSLPVGIGLMAILKIDFNIFNIALLPAFIAVGIEIPIQLMQRAREIKSGFGAVRDIAVSLQLSLLTTAVGFGTLVFTRAGVLKSLGWMSLLSTAAIWAVGIFVQPAILEYYFKKRRQAAPSNGIEGMVGDKANRAY